MKSDLVHELDEKDLILLCLGDHLRSDVSVQSNIDFLEDKIGLKKKTIERSLKELKKEEKITPDDTEQKEKSIDDYKLTEKGKKAREEIWEELKEQKIILIDDEDAIQLRLKNIIELLDDLSLIQIIKEVDERGVLDIRENKKTKEKLVGREKYMRKLTDLIASVGDKQVKTLFLAGDTGLGKTRLAEELKEKVLEEDFDFLEGKCFLEDQTPYAPFKDALDKFLKIDSDLDKVEGVISASRSSRGKAQSQKMFDAQRKSIFYETTQFLKDLSKSRPLIIFLDDLHWADSGTLNLLDYMADRLKDDPVILIGAYRPGDVSDSDQLKKTMRRMSRKKTLEKIEIEPLEEDSVEELIKILTDLDDIPEDFICNLKDKTNGNPLFVKESVHQMMKEGVIDEMEGKFPSEGEIFRIPNVVQNVIEKRVLDLSDNTREILQLGSVIGKEIPFELLVKASNKDELELLEDIDDLLGTKIWKENPREDSFLFSHDLFVDTVYEGLGKWLERKRHHLKIADAMEEVFDEDVDDKYFTLAHHFKKGEAYKKAFDYFLKAAEKAEKVYAHEEAIKRYEEALLIAKKTGQIEEEKEISLLEELGDISNIIGDFEGSKKYLEQALTKVGDVESKRRMYRKIARNWSDQGEFDKVIEITDEALSLVEMDRFVPEETEYDDLTSEEKGNTEEVCNLLSKKGWALRRKGEYEKAKEIFFEELDKAKKLDDRAILAQAYHDLGSFMRGNIDNDDCIDYLQRSIQIRKELLGDENSFEHKYALVRSYNNLGATHGEMREIDDALSYFQKSLKLNKEINNKLGQIIILNNLSILKKEKGELERSEELLDNGFEILARIDNDHPHHLLKNSQGMVDVEKGCLETALQSFQEAKEIAEDIGFLYGVAEVIQSISEVHTMKGNLEEAIEWVDKGLELAEKIESSRLIGAGFIQKGKIKRFEGDIEEAIKNHEKALEMDDKLNLFNARCELVEDHLSKGDIDKAEKYLDKAKNVDIETKNVESKLAMLQGIVLVEKGDINKAEEHLKRSLELTKELSKKYRIGRVYYELGMLQLKMKDTESAKKFLNKSKEIFSEMGIEYRLKEVEKGLGRVDMS